MDEKQTNRVTIEDLARMVSDGFNSLASKTDLDRLETNFSAILVKMDSRLDRLEGRVGEMDARLERIEATLHLVATAVADNRDFARRLEQLEAKMR